MGSEIGPPSGKYYDAQGKPLSMISFDFYNRVFTPPHSCEWLEKDVHLYEFHVFKEVGEFQSSGNTRSYHFKGTVMHADDDGELSPWYYDESVSVTEIRAGVYELSGSLTSTGTGYSINYIIAR